jgi:hypothetical protein
MAGGSSDQTTQSTSNNYDQRQVVTNNTTNNDLSDRSVTTTNNDLSNRSVNTTNNDLSDHSTNFSSTSNLWDASTKIDNHSVVNNDLSNRSVNNSVTTTTTNNDLSNRSVSNVWTDSSNRSVTNYDDHSVTNVLDAGAVAGGLAVANNAVAAVAGAAAGGVKVAADSLAGMLQTALAAVGLASSVSTAEAANTAHAYDYADQIFSGALDAVNRNDARALDAFDRAAKMEEGALVEVQNAYADAKGTTQAQQKIMLAVLAVAGAAVLASKMGK